MLHLVIGKGKLFDSRKTRKGKIFVCVLDVTYVVKRRGWDSQSTICRMQDYSPVWGVFVNPRGIVWVMPNKITLVLHSWDEARAGAWIVHIWCRIQGKREISGVFLKTIAIQYKRSETELHLTFFVSGANRFTWGTLILS